MKKLTIAKFGGTSMGGAAQISKVAEVVANLPAPRLAVVSATSGTTNMLIQLCEEAVEGGPWEETLAAIIKKHAAIVAELDLADPETASSATCNLTPLWEILTNIIKGVSLLGELSPSARDRIISFGEHASSRILTALLNKQGTQAAQCNAQEFTFTDNNFGAANVDFEKTNPAIVEKFTSLLAKGITPVVTGFVAQAENGKFSTLGRGGSDYTAAIIGGALEADEVQIWTDVAGIYNADPRIIPAARPLEQLSFAEASELAYFGAKVLHPKTIKPAVAQDIPVRILNTFDPEAPGTVITSTECISLKSVTYKKGISIINVCSAGMFNARGFMAQLFEVFAHHNVAVDVVATSEVNVSVTVDNGIPEGLINDLEKFSTVTVQKHRAIMCIVGAEIRTDAGILGELFMAIQDHNVDMVSQGSSKNNITFLVAEDEAQEITQKVFNTFFLSTNLQDHNEDRNHRSNRRSRAGNAQVSAKTPVSR
jgi:aspartate kinase